MKNIFVYLLITLSLFTGCDQSAQKDKGERLFIGTITRDPGTGIYSVLFNSEDGTFSDLRRENAASRPSFIASSPDDKFLYAFGGDSTHFTWIRSFKIGNDERTLITIDSIPGQVVDYCHITPLDGGKIVSLACYHEGKLTYTPVDKEGKFGELRIIPHDTTETEASGRVSHVHQVRQIPGDKYIYVPDLGLDRIFIYEVSGGELVKNAEIPTAEGAGPRHVDFHPSGKYMALINELNSTVSIYGKDNEGRFIKEIQTLPTYTEGYEGNKAGADIHFSPDGRFLYVSDRGFNSIVWYSINETDGSLVRLGSVNEGISTPRNFGIHPSGQWLLVGNQNGNSIVTYAIDTETGALTFTQGRLDMPTPSCILF